MSKDIEEQLPERLAEEYMKFPRRIDNITIPVELWFHPELNGNDLKLLMEIHMLDSGDRHCYASNSYLAWFMRLSESQTTRILTKLESMGLIEIENRDNKNRQISSQLKKMIPIISKYLQPLIAKSFRKTLPSTSAKMLRNLSKNAEVNLSINADKRKEKNSIRKDSSKLNTFGHSKKPSNDLMSEWFEKIFWPRVERKRTKEQTLIAIKKLKPNKNTRLKIVYFVTEHQKIMRAWGEYQIDGGKVKPPYPMQDPVRVIKNKRYLDELPSFPPGYIPQGYAAYSSESAYKAAIGRGEKAIWRKT